MTERSCIDTKYALNKPNKYNNKKKPGPKQFARLSPSILIVEIIFCWTWDIAKHFRSIFFIDLSLKGHICKFRPYF